MMEIDAVGMSTVIGSDAPSASPAIARVTHMCDTRTPALPLGNACRQASRFART